MKGELDHIYIEHERAFMSIQVSGRVSIGGSFTSDMAEEIYGVMTSLSGCGINNAIDMSLGSSTGTLDFFKADDLDDGLDGVTYFSDYGAPISVFEPIVKELIDRNCSFDCWIFGKEHYGLLDSVIDMRIIINRIDYERPLIFVGNLSDEFAITAIEMASIISKISHKPMSDLEMFGEIKSRCSQNANWSCLSPFIITSI